MPKKTSQIVKATDKKKVNPADALAEKSLQDFEWFAETIWQFWINAKSNISKMNEADKNFSIKFNEMENRFDRMVTDCFSGQFGFSKESDTKKRMLKIAKTKAGVMEVYFAIKDKITCDNQADFDHIKQGILNEKAGRMKKGQVAILSKDDERLIRNIIFFKTITERPIDFILGADKNESDDVASALDVKRDKMPKIAEESDDEVVENDASEQDSEQKLENTTPLAIPPQNPGPMLTTSEIDSEDDKEVPDEELKNESSASSETEKSNPKSTQFQSEDALREIAPEQDSESELENTTPLATPPQDPSFTNGAEENATTPSVMPPLNPASASVSLESHDKSPSASIIGAHEDKLAPQTNEKSKPL